MKVRIAVLAALVIVTATVFVWRLVQWQIIGEGYLNDEAVVYTVCGERIRGEIFDRNGIGLAVNTAEYRVVLNKLFIRSDEQNEIIARLIELMNECGEKRTDSIPVRIENGRTVFDKSDVSAVNRLISIAGSDDKQETQSSGRHKADADEGQETDAEECMRRLAELYGCEDYPEEMRREIISVRLNMTEKGYCREQPYIFAQGISERTMTVIAERMSGIGGVTVETAAVRKYANGTAAPHIVGVTGLISKDEYELLCGEGYSYTDTIGKSGVEAAYENELRGKAGTRTYREDSEGNVSLASEEPAQPGDSLYLTIDIKLQQTAQDALREAVAEARAYGEQTGSGAGADCTGGAAVVLDAKDFSVLCAASWPSYDLSSYYEDYGSLAQDEAFPLFDRAFAGALAPGSTFKPLTAIAALQEKKITVNTRIRCSGIYTKNGLSLRCMGYHGDEDLDGATVDSCNVFFAETGRLTGIEILDEYAVRFGLGVRTGVEIYESAGTLAGPAYCESVGSEWYSSFVSPAAIGQSDHQFTPLQLAVYTATIANGGRRMKPRVVDRTVKYGTDEVIKKTAAELVTDTGVSRENLEAVRLAMLHAAESYDALDGCGVSVAGKTGTAENSGPDHANFICFAPYDDPQIAVAVMVGHGAKSRVAVNVGRKLLEAYFNAQTHDESSD